MQGNEPQQGGPARPDKIRRRIAADETA